MSRIHFLTYSKLIQGGQKKYTLCGIEKEELNGQGNSLWVTRAPRAVNCERCIKVANEIVGTVQRISA